MQVNILLDFTEITMHVLQGQLTPPLVQKKKKNPLAFPACVNDRFSFHTRRNLVMEMYSFFHPDTQYRTGHISLLIQQPLIIMGHGEGKKRKKLDLHIVGPINK